MARYLILRLDAPLVSFGNVVVDNYGFTEIWPAASLLTGLIGNALGYQRTQGSNLDALQARLDFACRLDRAGQMVRDFQTAALNKDDQGWTTRGEPEGRDGGAGTYLGKHIRYRDFIADSVVVVALGLERPDETPTLDDIAAALIRPARPLFIGRKPCVPARPIFSNETADAVDAFAAVRNALRDPWAEDSMRALATWRGASAGAPQQTRTRTVHGQRNWRSGVHGGAQIWHEGEITLPEVQT